MVTTKRTGPANLQPRGLAVAVAAAFMPVLPLAAYGQTTSTTLPTGFTNVVGGASVAVSGSTMNVNSASNAEINNWQTFSIGSSATVNFNQLGAGSVSLNRVVGNNPSEIFGRLTANGQVFLVNNSGVLFARGSSVDVGGLFVTSLSIADRDFLAGRYQFFNPGNAGAVINQGNIITANGYAALAGPQVRNDGVIVARSGSVALAAGDRVSLDIIGDGLISLSVDQAALNASAINSGRIEADGGMVLLTARSANALLDTVINNSGVIRANSLVERNGEIVLDGGSTGVVSVTGSLEAAGLAAGTTGGTIKVLGDKVGLFDGASLNASGDAGGGTVLVGGNWQGKGPERNASATIMASSASVSADALTSGDGGTVVLWSDDSTKVHGTISARGGALSGNGGNVETSGHYLDIAGARVDTRAPNGKGGNWLLDPFDVTIVDDGAGTSANGSFDALDPNTWTPNDTPSLVSDQDINDNLANTSVTITTVNVSGTDAGDITVETDVSIVIPASRTLTLNAERNIDVQGDASFAGADPSSVLALNIGQAGGNGTLTISANATLPSSASGTINVTGGGGTDSVVVALDTNMTLSDSQLALDGNYTLNLSSIEAANLTGGGGANTFTVANWTGTANLSGLASADVFNVTLSASGTVNVIGAGGSDTLNATGNGSINVNATAVENGQVVTYGAEQVNVLGQGGNDTVTITATAGTANYSIDGGGGTNAVVVGADANFTLADALLQVDDGGANFLEPNISLFNVTVANLTGGASNNTFDVTGWTGAGALDGGTGSDSVIVVSKDVNFTLSDSALTSSDNMSLALAGIEVADLTGGGSANTFTVANWTGTANLTGLAIADVFNVTLAASGTVNVDGGGGSDTLNAIGNGAINVNDTAVENGQVVTYNATVVEQVNVLGQGASDTVTITATAGTANYSVDGGGGTNAVVVSTDANFTLDNTLLQVNGSGGFAQTNVSLASVTVANLTAGASDNTFTVSGWTGSGALNGAGGTGDRIVETDDVNFTLTNGALARSGQGTLTLASIEVANLTGGGSNNNFTVSGWTGSGTFDGAGGAGNRILATNDVNFTLTNDTLARSGLANLTLANITLANLGGGGSANVFDVSGWTGGGNITGLGEDTLVVDKDVNFTLSNTFIATSDGMNMSLQPTMGTANLTGGGGNNTFTVTSWLADANLLGLAGADTFNLTLTGTTSNYSANGGGGVNTVNVIGTTGADVITISNTSVTTSLGEVVTYVNADTVTVSGGPGASGDSFTISSVAPNVSYTVHGTLGTDTLNITALNQNVTLTGGANGTISNVGSFTTIENLVGANTLIGGVTWSVTGANSGTVDAFAFSGTGNLLGSAGNDTFTMGAGGSLTLNGGTISGGGGVDTLTGSSNANTWTITGANSGTLSGVAGGWSGISNLVGGTGSDSFTGAGGAVNITDGAGGTTTLTNLQSTGTLTTSGATALNGTIQSGGNQTYSGAVTLGSAAIVTSTGAAVNFGSTVNGAFDLAANAATSANFNGSVNIGSLSVVAPAISLAGVTTTGAQTYNGTASVANTFTTNGGAFTVNGGTVVVANTGVNTGAGPAAFNGTINGPGQLTVNGGGTTFNDQLGNTSALAGLIVSGPVTFNTGTVNTAGSIDLSSGVVTVPGAITFSTGGGTFNASNAGNDFMGTTSVLSGGGSITLFDANNLTLGPIDAGAGFVTLNAGSLQGTGPVTGGNGSITSLADISGLGLNMPGNMLVAGTGSVQSFNFSVASGASQPGSYTQGGDVAVFINGQLAFPNSQFSTIGSVIGNAAQAAGAIIVEEANKTFGTDSVAEDIEYGFAGEIGATPPMDHRIDESGISLPRCVQEAREGLPCK